jgi:putative ABC transport system permease protein
MNPELFEIAARNLRKQGIRTYLTLIGVIIGIGAIVALLSVGAGLNFAIEKQFEQLGSNTIFVIPGVQAGGQGVTSFKDSDVKRLEALRGVETVVPVYGGSAVLEFNGEKVNVSIMAADAEKSRIFEDTGYFEVKEGRWLTKSDTSAVAVGQLIAENYFSDEIILRNRVSINGVNYRVVGILKNQSQTIGGGWPEQRWQHFHVGPGL